MNKPSILLTGLVLLIVAFIFSCEKDDIASTEVNAYGKLEIIHGDNQSGYFGEFLSDSIVIKASSNNNSRSYLIKWEMIQGNGDIEGGYLNNVNEYIVDNSGLLEIKWRLGCDMNIQKVKLSLYVDSTRNEYGYLNYHKNPSHSLIISANGTKPTTGWAKSCGSKGLDEAAAKIISYDDNTLYLVNRGLYKSTDQGLNWYKVEGVPHWDNIVDAQFNSSGWLYLLVKDYGVSYSMDLLNWEYINNGILEYTYPRALLVEDSTLFVSFGYDGLYRTSDNGGFWRKLHVGGGGGDYYEISRHPNGDLYVFDTWSDLFISKNSGDNWEAVEIDHKYVYSTVYDMVIDEYGNIYIGANDARISKITVDTYEGEIHDFYEMNHSSQHVEDIKIINNIVYFTVNGNPTPGIYSSQNWQRLEIGFDKRIYNYYLKKDGTFLLISSDGLYYYSK